MSREEDLRARVLLSAQRGLWDVVTPDLRGVAMSWDLGCIRARFIYEGDCDERVELVQEAEAVVLADFDEPVETEFKAVTVPSAEPRALLAGEVWVFLRRET